MLQYLGQASRRIRDVAGAIPRQVCIQTRIARGFSRKHANKYFTISNVPEIRPHLPRRDFSLSGGFCIGSRLINASAARLSRRLPLSPSNSGESFCKSGIIFSAVRETKSKFSLDYAGPAVLTSICDHRGNRLHKPGEL